MTEAKTMNPSVEMLEAEALRLSPADRARLVARLMASLDGEPGAEEAWAEEVERRNAEVDSGAVSLVPGNMALDELRTRYR